MHSLLDTLGPGLAGLFISSFIIGLSGAVMPGPVLAVTINHAARRGAKAGPLIVLGHALLEGPLVLALALGLGALIARPGVSGVIGGVGAVILFWLGAGMLRSLPGLRLDLEAGPGQAGLAGAWGPVKDGALLSLANPYWSLWWATVGLGFMAVALRAGQGGLGLLAFFLGHISADLVWYLAVAFLVAKGRRFLSQRLYQGVVAVCALCILGFGVYFGLFAWQMLARA